MDDRTRTQKTLDDLADLFLTGTVAAPLHPPQTDGSVSKPDPLDAPGPVQLFPEKHNDPYREVGVGLADEPTSHAASGHERNAVTPTRDLYKLAGDPSWEGHPPAEPHTPSVHVEAVLLGNLPGFSGPWLTQYAQYLAKQHGPVGVLSIDENGVDVDLVAPNHEILNNLGALAETPDDEPHPLLSVLNRLAQARAGRVNTWLVHIPTPVSACTHVVAWELPQWTLLCGADDAAIVGAYRLLKQLSMSPSDDENSQASPTPRVGVMVMGSDDGASQTAAMKLNHAAGSFLDTPVEWVGCQKQMQPVNTQAMGYFASDTEDLLSQVHCFLYGLMQPSPKDPSDGRASANQAIHPPLKETAHLQAGEPQIDESDGPVRNTPSPLSTQPAQPTIESPEPQPPQPPQPPPQPISSQADPTEDFDMSRFLSVEGILLKARCPVHSQVQLLLDEQGALHLLMHHTGLSRTDRTGEIAGRLRMRAAVVDLIEVKDWVRRHLDLLDLTEPRHKFDHKAQPVLHLFTDQAKAAVSLIGQVGPFVKMHLLENIQIEDKHDWRCTELN